MVASPFKMFFQVHLVPLVSFLFIGAAHGLCGISSSQNCASVSNIVSNIICYFGDTGTTYTLDAAGANTLANDPNYSKSKITAIFTPGFTRTPDSPGSVAIRDAMRQKSATVNYCVVDVTNIFAGDLNNPFSYTSVAPNSVCLGRRLGAFLVALYQNGVSPNAIQLIGHSLGAPTSSMACKHVTSATGMKILTLTALDSVLLCFLGTAYEPQPSDAQHVQAIHTNSGMYGTPSKLGHADFYVNGGSYQPGCNLGDITCSHAFSLFYYAESINSVLCVGFKYIIFLLIPFVDKTQTAVMGWNWAYESGDYYVPTNNAPMYCRGSSG